MRMRILAAVLFSLICIIPGSKVGYFDGLPLSAVEIVTAFFVFLGIFATEWDERPLLKRSILATLFIFLALQLLSFKALPYGWNVCIRSTASVSVLESNCEPSLEFRSGEKSFIYDDIRFDKKTFPLYFFNNTASFNFYLPEQPERSSLPFTIEASTYIIPKKDDRLTVRADKDVTIKINDSEFIYHTSKKPGSVSLIPDTLNHVSIRYETDRNKKNVLAAQLPENHFFKTQGVMPSDRFVKAYQLLNSALLLLLITCFGYGFIARFRLLKKQDRFVTALLGALSISYFVFVWQNVIDLNISAILFATILICSSFYYVISEKLIRKVVLPFILLTLFIGSCSLTTSHTMPEQAILFSGGNDELGHEAFARHTILATDFKEFASAAEPGRLYYYQPLHRYFLAVFHAIFGEPMWGVYVAQTILFSLAFLFSSLVLFKSIGLAALITFSGLSLLLLSLPQTSIVGIIQSPYQQGIALSLLMIALVQIAAFIKNPQQKFIVYFFWGTLIGATFMMRTDWLVTFSGIMLSVFFVTLSSAMRPIMRLQSLSAMAVGLSIFPLLVGIRNYYIAGKFAIMPTSGFVNLINELAVPLKTIIPLHENSASVFVKEIAHLFTGRYEDLLLILWSNVYKHIIDPTIVREGLWVIGGILIIFSVALFFSAKRGAISHYIALTCFSASFLALIAVNSFFFQHNGMAMYGAYDFILLLILATGTQIISDRFGILEYTRIKLSPYLQKIYAFIK